jgi:hypothetical protein
VTSEVRKKFEDAGFAGLDSAKLVFHGGPDDNCITFTSRILDDEPALILLSKIFTRQPQELLRVFKALSYLR